MVCRFSRRRFFGVAGIAGIGPLAVAQSLAARRDAPPPRRSGWRVYIMTDMEGVAGVLDSDNWCKPEGRYYEVGKELLTQEVNAAIEGFARAGAAEFLVADGHGHGGINPKLLDARAELARYWTPSYPFSLEKGMDFAAWVGQHAMSRSEFAHLPHTGSFGTFETTINGRPMGEFGEVAVCAGQLGVRTIFGSGDLAFSKEAAALFPGIETVAVKRGTVAGRGDECDRDTYAKRNLGAIHLQPERAKQKILAAAERALRRAVADGSLGVLTLKPPFERVTILRPHADQPRRVGRASHASDIVALMNTPLKFEPVKNQY